MFERKTENPAAPQPSKAEALIGELRKAGLDDGKIAEALKQKAAAGEISDEELSAALSALEKAKAEQLFGMKFI